MEQLDGEITQGFGRQSASLFSRLSLEFQLFLPKEFQAFKLVILFCGLSRNPSCFLQISF
jgi:hypothetical protein